MERKKLKSLISQLKMIVDEIESEIYSDTSSYENQYFDFDDKSYITDYDDDGYPDWGKKIMYEDLDCFEKALTHFGTRVEIIVALEMGNKMDSETAYQMIKAELKQVKKIRKLNKEEICDDC